MPSPRIKSLAFGFMTVALIAAAAWGTYKYLHPIPSPPKLAVYTVLDNFQRDLAVRAGSQIDPNREAQDFHVWPAAFSEDVGTVLRPNSTYVISYDICAPHPHLAREKNYPNLLPEVRLTQGIAVDAGLDPKAIKGLSDAHVKIENSDTYQLSIEDPKITWLDDAAVEEITALDRCSRLIKQKGHVWLVRGAVSGKRVFEIASKDEGALGGKSQTIGQLSISGNLATSKVAIRDTESQSFLLLVSEIVPSADQREGVKIIRPSEVRVENLQNGKIYVQQDATDDRFRGASIVQALQNELHLPVVAKVELVPTAKMPSTPQVRYFNDSDLEEANSILNVLRAKLDLTASRDKAPVAVRVRLPAPTGQLEVWIPKVSPTQPSTSPHAPTPTPQSQDASPTGAQQIPIVNVEPMTPAAQSAPLVGCWLSTISRKASVIPVHLCMSSDQKGRVTGEIWKGDSPKVKLELRSNLTESRIALWAMFTNVRSSFFPHIRLRDYEVEIHLTVTKDSLSGTYKEGNNGEENVTFRHVSESENETDHA